MPEWTTHRLFDSFNFLTIRGAAHLGLRAHPPPACAHGRAGGRPVAGWIKVDRRPRYFLTAKVLPVVFRRLFWRCSSRRTIPAPAVLRRSCQARRCQSLRRLSGTTAQQQMGGLLQTPLWGARGSLALSRPLHPPRRHLKPSLDCSRPERGHLQMEGLSPRRPAAIQGDDAPDSRVHPPFPDPRAARRLPPHPLLWPARQRQRAGTSREHANCWRCHYSRSMPSKPPAPMPPNRKHQSIPAPAAAAA